MNTEQTDREEFFPGPWRLDDEEVLRRYADDKMALPLEVNNSVFRLGRFPKNYNYTKDRVQLRFFSVVLDSIDEWRVESHMRGPAWSEQPIEQRIEFLIMRCIALVYALGCYLTSSGVNPFIRVSCIVLANLEKNGGTPESPVDFELRLLRTAALGALERLRVEIVKLMTEIHPGKPNWEAKLRQWAKLAEPGWIDVVRTAADAIEAEEKPLKQEELAPYFGGETNCLKRPLARATDFGLFERYSKPRGYWPTYLNADPSWTRSVRTNPR
jgi:hypothetical protein